MEIHPQIRAALESSRDFPPYQEVGIVEARRQAKLAYDTGVTRPEVAAVTNLEIDGTDGTFGLRLYRPFGSGPFPVVLFFHGSGFVLLDVDTHDLICRRLCLGANCVVASVDYRLAPEYPFPVGLTDCIAAADWVRQHVGEYAGDASRIAIAGDSAGGCLSAGVTLHSRDSGGPEFTAQLLFYPVTDFHTPPTESYREYASGFGLTRDTMKWFWSLYLGGEDREPEPRAAPLRAASLARLPRTLVLTAQYDVLRDEGEAFGSRLGDFGVESEVRRCEALNHGFLRWLGLLPEVDAIMDIACEWLSEQFREEGRA